MATEADVKSVQQEIHEVWTNPPVRDNLFGNVLRSVKVAKIRGLNLTVEFQWPVVAIGGVNGSGKTTLLQVCSAAYTKAGSASHYYTIGRWISPALGAETPPIAPDAVVNFAFWDQTPTFAIPYKEEQTKWGYPRRGNPSRNVEFIGITNFAPRIERLDRTHQHRSQLNIVNTDAAHPRVVESVSRILDCPYTSLASHTVSVPNAQWSDKIPELRRGASTYTEGHMGAGEQKIVRLIASLEALPSKSLVLLEEPELTLHPDAQYGLAWYVMALARRKGHQIIIATHSPHIFEALPKQGRVILSRDNAGIAVLHGVTHLKAARELSKSVRTNADLVLVEDAVGHRLLTEIFRRFSKDLLANATIVEVGSAQDVQRMVARLREQDVRAIGVRDPDFGGAPPQGLFSLPGNQLPEQLLLDPANVARTEQFWNGITEAVALARVQGQGLQGAAQAKRVFAALCKQVDETDDFLSDRLTLGWLSDPGTATACNALVQAAQQALDAAA